MEENEEKIENSDPPIKIMDGSDTDVTGQDSGLSA